MDFKNKLFASLFVSFILLLGSLILSYQGINKNNKMILSIEKKQIKLSYFANKLNHDIEMNQANLLQSIVLDDKFSINNSQSSLKELVKLAYKLEVFVQKSEMKKSSIDDIISKIKRRMISYKAVQASLREAIKSENTEDIQDAVIGFNAITVKFAQDIERLIDLSNEILYTNLLALKESNQKSSNTLLISFVTAFTLIFFSIYKFNLLNLQINKELRRAEEAEKEQKKLQHQLLKYNDDLEGEITKKSKELHHRIYTHFISGLPNRNKLLEDANIYNFKQMALFNIDKFQKFNDVYGEEIGNIAIKMSADFLAERILDNNTLLYHIGGDEFVFVVKNDEELNQPYFLENIEDILKDYSKENFVYDGKKFNLIMSAGIAFSGRKKMLAYADMALKDAKSRNIQLSVFNDDRALEKIHKGDIECHKKLLHALESNNVLSYFQPILPIQNSKKATKYESLVRLKDEEGNIIPPFNFIHVAKTNRIYNKITHTVLDNTLDIIKKYHVPCSINISMDDIDNPQTLKLLYNRFDTYEYNHLLTIELLETEEFKDYNIVFDFCTHIRSYGIKIALDDFGAGYSNFSHILKLPVDFIKIDASLISNIDRDTNSVIMVETIVGLAKKLHIETIAEFVSSAEILEVVKEIGVDYAQGYHIGKPEPIENHLDRLS